MSAIRDRLRVVAHFPGRLRVRADTFRILPEVARDVIDTIGGEPGVSSVTASELTGSVLILYDPRQTQLLRLIRRLIQVSGVHGVEVDDQELADSLAPGARVREAVGDADARLRRATSGKVDLRVAFPGALAALGVGKLIFGNATLLPQWYDLLFWSFTAFVNVNPPRGHDRPASPDPHSDHET